MRMPKFLEVGGQENLTMTRVYCLGIHIKSRSELSRGWDGSVEKGQCHIIGNWRLIVMAESLLPLKGGCPNIHKWGTLLEIKFSIQKFDQKGLKHRGVQKNWVWYSSEGDLVEIQSWKQVEAQGLHACSALLQEGCSRVSRGCTGRMGVSEGPGFGLEDAWRGVDDCVYQWRVTSWIFEAMDCQKNAAQYPVDNRNHSGRAIAVSWVQPCDLVQQCENKCQWFPSRSLEVVSLMTAWIQKWCRSEWWEHQMSVNAELKRARWELEWRVFGVARNLLGGEAWCQDSETGFSEL